METKGWKVIDHYNEHIMGVYFETKEKAEGFMNDMIKVCKENNKNYDYDVDYIRSNYTILLDDNEDVMNIFESIK